MAPIAGKPFLSYLLKYLENQGVERFILSLGYKHEMIEKFIYDQFSMLNVQFSIEEEPLGTGGAIKLACTKVENENVWIVNGDTFFRIDLNALMDFHCRQYANCTIALKRMQNFSRYGAVELDSSGQITNFHEKQFFKEGFINGGLYTLNISSFMQENLQGNFSFEKDYLETYHNSRKIFGKVEDEYFIDIGIPGDYEKAQLEVDSLIS